MSTLREMSEEVSRLIDQEAERRVKEILLSIPGIKLDEILAHFRKLSDKEPPGACL